MAPFDRARAGQCKMRARGVEQAIDRAGVKLGNKGFEAGMTAVELANLYKEAFEA